jgi:RNA-binding protein 23/39
MHMNAQGRAALMAKLGQGAGLQVSAAAAAMNTLMPPAAVVSVRGGGNVSATLVMAISYIPWWRQGAAGMGPPPITGTPSLSILVRNMFDPASETEPNWDLDIKEDVEDECQKAGGRVVHSHVEKNQPGGLVYLLFTTVDGATKAAHVLNGRWFAGRMIRVEYLTMSAYLAMFPQAGEACRLAGIPIY